MPRAWVEPRPPGSPSYSSPPHSSASTSSSDRAQMKADKAAAKAAAKEQRSAMRKPAAYGDHSGGVGTGAGSTSELGNTTPGGNCQRQRR